MQRHVPKLITGSRLVLAAAFFGMFSTTLGVLDGFPRAFEETLRRLRGRGPGVPGGRGADRARVTADRHSAVERLVCDDDATVRSIVTGLATKAGLNPEQPTVKVSPHPTGGFGL